VKSEGSCGGVLGVPSLVLFGLVYMVPLTVFTTYGVFTKLTGGRLVVAYLVTLAAMVFTAWSYARMAAIYPMGPVRTYATRSGHSAPGSGSCRAGCSARLPAAARCSLPRIGIYSRPPFPRCPDGRPSGHVGVVTVLNIVGIVSVVRATL